MKTKQGSFRTRAGSLAAAGLCAALLAAPAAAQQQLTVTHYGVALYGVPFAVAMEEGFFAEEGVEIEGVLTGQGGGTTVRNTLASGLPYGEAGLAAVMAAQNSGLDLVIVNSATDNPRDLAWVTMPDRDFSGIESLAGESVAITNPKGGAEQLAKMSLEAAGMAPDAVTLVAAGGIREALAALEGGGVAAAPLIEPLLTRMAGKYKVVFRADEYIPLMTQTVGFTTRAFAEENPDVIRGIVAARARAVELLYEDPARAAGAVATVWEMEPEMAETLIRELAAANYWSRGNFSREGLDANIVGLKLVDALEGEEPEWNAIIDQQYLPPELQGEL